MDEDIFGAGLFSVFSESQSKASTVPSSDKNESGRKRRLEGLSKASASAPSDKKTARDGASASISVTEDISVTVETEEDDEAKKIKVQITEELSIVEKRMQVHRLDTLESCVHEVAVPPTCEYAPLKVKTDKPAKEYKFILDPFQKQAVLCLENHQSVLVSAHTSAGKTVVAEYAIAMSLRDKQRVIYTTPIKALSNQKYRELYEEFQDVGLMTGDITINPGASCLIMTTEILRSMLYRGSEVMREVAWVIFDEIHYMRDKERGVVWEETIILLPDNVHYVFLSATIPNATQFAEWIAYLHKQPCHVVYTDYRPTPLQHYIFPAGGDGIHLVVDEKGEFREENFNTAMSVLKDGDEAGKDQRGKKMAGRGGGGKEAINVFKIVQMIMERNMAPAIVFSFSKKQCEAYAIQMSKLDLNSDKEKELVEEVFKNAVSSLSEDDKKLPQVEHVLPLLKKGIGVHHSGLLPLLKETVEVLFGEGLLKVLFATETFAMGLNMPARTVLFSAARKFDGKDFRWLSSGEFIQMSGRAGRRGIDDRGIVILMLDEKISPGIAKQILKGQPDPLNSAFHLTYNMVLNLLRVEEINPEYMLEKSFYQFQNYAAIPELTEKLRQLEKKFSSCIVPSEDQVSSYYRIRQQLQQLASEMQSNFITKPQYILPFLQAGRLVKVVNGEHDFGWAVVINFQKKADQSKAAAEGTEAAYVVDVLMHVSKDSSATGSTSALRPPAAGTKGDMVVVPILLSLVTNVSAVRLYMPQDLRPQDNRLSVLKSLQEVQKRFPDGLPQLDPVDDMGIKDKGLKELVRKIDAFEERLYAHPLHNDSKLPELYRAYEEKMKLGLEIKALKVELKKKRSLLQMDELKCRKRVLRRLGYATASDVIEMKGRVACEISSADELLLTELLFAGTFNNLTAAQVTALISCVVCQEKSAELPKLSEALSASLRVMQETAKRIARVSQEAKLELDEEEYLKTIQPSLMDVVHAWCNGVSFAQVCKMTDVFEGSIIRCMRRLEETLRQMCQAAKAIGNIELEAKFSEGIRLMKRDIVFAASLYL